MDKFFKIAAFALGLFFSFQLQAQVDYENIQAKSFYTGSWLTYRTKLVRLIPDYIKVTDGRDDFTRYGTYKYLHTDSTGFFYVKKIDGRWWMVDPEGYAGMNMAVTSFTSSNIQNDYDIVKKNGYNGSGNFLSSEGQTKTGYNLQNYVNFSFTRRLNFFLSYKNDRKNYYTTPKDVQGSLDHILVLDPQFAIYCDELASSKVSPFADERDLLGYFTDNEINFNQDQLRNLVRDLPEGDPSRNAALAFAETKGLTADDCINYTSKVTEDIKKEFATLLAEHYFKTVSEAIRKYDPNHMILGSRLHGRPRGIAGVVNASHKYMDITSVNFYDKFRPSDEISKETWSNDHPCLVTEFYIKDINAFKATQPGAGWYVNSQANRGYFYQNSCIELLQNKCYVGWHYFRFKDDEDSNKGMVDYANGKEYTDMTAYMKELNEQVYRICDFYDGKFRRPEYGTKEQVIEASEDTWVVPGTNTTNYGNDTQLEVRYSVSELNRREAFFKFDLSSVKDKLPLLKHATFEVTCTSGDEAARSLFVSGIEDTSWKESTLTGRLRSENTDWKNGYNRLDFQKSAINPGTLSFDVTTWIFDHAQNDTTSFKLHEMVSTTTSLEFASREHADKNYRPRLVLTFWDSSSSGVNNPVSDKQFMVFPNPVSDFLCIEGEAPFQAEIYTYAGQLAMQTDKNKTNISSLSPGIYVLKITPKEGISQVNKIIKI